MMKGMKNENPGFRSGFYDLNFSLSCACDRLILVIVVEVWLVVVVQRRYLSCARGFISRFLKNKRGPKSNLW
jgi:hypothetical protein